MKNIGVVIKKAIQTILGTIGINPFEHSYDEIPLATRFFRNRPLIKTVFDLVQRAHLNNSSFFFHACSTGEEPYSYAMYKMENTGLSIKFQASDYNHSALDIARVGVYDEKTVDLINSGYISDKYKKYFNKVDGGYSLNQSVRLVMDDFIIVDYTKIDDDWASNHRADVVFCNSTLLYHSHQVQEFVLERLCIQASEILVLTGVENRILEKVLKKHGFIPYKENWEAVYDGCPLRRVKNDPVYRTPTTPYLSDRNKVKDHYFRYSVFYKSGGRVSHALDEDVSL